jgi:hypothetical protein
MTEPPKIEVVRRAYQLWQEAGQPAGKDWEFYLQAERELKAAGTNGKDPSHRTPDNL